MLNACEKFCNLTIKLEQKINSFTFECFLVTFFEIRRHTVTIKITLSVIKHNANEF